MREKEREREREREERKIRNRLIALILSHSFWFLHNVENECIAFNYLHIFHIYFYVYQRKTNTMLYFLKIFYLPWYVNLCVTKYIFIRLHAFYMKYFKFKLVYIFLNSYRCPRLPFIEPDSNPLLLFA